MRIPKINKSAEIEPQKNESGNSSCLFCSQPVKQANLAMYENHLIQRHNLEKNIQQVILDTFNSHKKPFDKKNDELFSFKSVKDVMETIEKITKEKHKGTFRSHTKVDYTDPFKDLLAFVDDGEKDLINTRSDLEKLGIGVSKPVLENKVPGTVHGLKESTPVSVKDEAILYNCNSCDKSYDRAAKLKLHDKKVHSKNKEETNKTVIAADIVRNESEAPENTKESNDHVWAEFLIFECKVCSTRMPSSMQSNHLLTWHSLSVSDYKSKTGDYILLPANYQCLVCLKELPWTKELLITHLPDHKLNLDQYYVIFDKAIKKQVDKQTEIIKHKTQVLDNKEHEKEGRKENTEAVCNIELWQRN